MSNIEQPGAGKRLILYKLHVDSYWCFFEPTGDLFMASDKQLGTILVADDNADIRKFAKVFLETAGWSVLAAADGEEALQFYRAHQSAIVLLLTDVMMPKVNGYELADRVLWIDSKLPVLFMSGDQKNAYRGLECVPKPFRPRRISRKSKPGSAREWTSGTSNQAVKPVSAQ